MANELLRKIQRGLKKPPKVIAQRVLTEALGEVERFVAPVRARRMDTRRLLQELNFPNLDRCWQALAQQPFATAFDLPSVDDAGADTLVGRTRILDAAQRAMRHEVDLMGSGPTQLGESIDWQQDYKTGFRWAPAYFRSINYNNLLQPSDVKFPWELSRLQWLIPVGQAFHLTRDERYARFTRGLLEDWMNANPYAHSINWACTMEVAIRLFSWTWFFHVFHASDAWKDAGFRARFLRMVYLHGDFTARHLEKSDVNGNHYTADAAGLVFAGLFFGERGRAAGWHALGWQILTEEMPLQVFADGVDFEASVPYHRLVLELFLFPALYRIRSGFDVGAVYRDRLRAMAEFTLAYTRLDGSVPLWGDADDARALPMGGQVINDHRYLPCLVGAAIGDPMLERGICGDPSELLWWLGHAGARRCLDQSMAVPSPVSRAFPDGGFYIMRNPLDHVFIDCGPLGLAGRGGHGHNDALAFEAVLCGEHLVTDSGAYLYTADYLARNRFRSTASHNTPMVDDEEINRFIRPDYLWNLHDDARPELLKWTTSALEDRFKGCHRGYTRLQPPVVPMRTITLHHVDHRLTVRDEFDGDGVHRFEIPLLLTAETTVEHTPEGGLQLGRGEKCFSLSWHGAGAWQLRVEDSTYSVSYGLLTPCRKLIWQCSGVARQVWLEISLQPTTKAYRGVNDESRQTRNSETVG